MDQDGTEHPSGLELNKIYRVVAMKMGGGFYYRQRHSDMVLTEVAGVQNPRRMQMKNADPFFAATRFKKVLKKETDISIFTGMLKKKQLEKV
jgi:hypothetical protein